MLTGKEKSPHLAFFYYRDNELKAVRSGRWKLHLAVPQGRDAKGPPETALYDLNSDIGEQTNVLADHPQIAKRLREYVRAFKENLAQNSRPAAVAEHPKPLTK